jgi:thiamine-phosphate pyrophosphorylase
LTQDRSIAGRRLYLCTAARPDLMGFVEACIEGGVDVVQLRDKTLEARPLIAAASALVTLCHERGVPFILNDRPDLALEVGADGVHVGQDDAPVSLARRILGDTAIVGLSTHARAELDDAVLEPVDYVSAGPVAPTPTKAGRPGTGLGYLGEAADVCTAHAELPFFVTGGVSPETVPAMAAAGGRRYVVVRYLTEARDPGSAARRLREAIETSGDLVRDA